MVDSWEEFLKYTKPLDKKEKIISPGKNSRIIINPKDNTTSLNSDINKNFPYLKNSDMSFIDRNMAKKLIKGDLEYQALIDLHNLTLDQAHMKFNEFINNSYNKAYRAILVITGKGNNSDGKITIKSEIEKWINNNNLRSKILAFCYASPKNGGAGAILILLKKL